MCVHLLLYFAYAPEKLFAFDACAAPIFAQLYDNAQFALFLNLNQTKAKNYAYIE